MTKPEADRIAALKAEVARFMQRCHLLECFVDVRHREKVGLTTDQIREIWHGRPPTPEHGAV